MDYPIEIIPQPGYIVPFPLEKLREKEHDYLVCYRITGSVDDNLEEGSFNGGRVLKKSCFSHLAHMSMNLYGGLFKPEHVCFAQKKTASDIWDGKSPIKLKDYEGLFPVIDGATPIFYRASKLSVKGLTINMTFDNKDMYNSLLALYPAKTFPPYQKGIRVDAVTDVKIVHMPTNLNYWHLQLEVYPKGSEDELKNEKSWRLRIFEHIRDNRLISKFLISPDMDYQIEEKLYKRS